MARKHKDMPRKGFTLIEILIVVGIISILSSVILIGLGPTQRIGRDTRRIVDLRQVQTALDLYFKKCGYYPGQVQSGSTCNTTFSRITTWAQLTSSIIGSGLGVAQMPNDPTTGVSYLYGVASDGRGYVIGAVLEDPNNSALRDDIDGTINGVNCGIATSDTVYCLQL